MNIFNPNHGTITFRVKYPTSFGLEVRVAGNIEELGSWEPTHCLLMETTKESYPYWYSTQKITGPVGMEIYYKYLIYDKNINKYIWENEDGSNRFFVINLPGSFELNDEQGNKECKVKRIEDDNIIENISMNMSDNNEQMDVCDFANHSLLKNEIFEMLSYDSVKFESHQMALQQTVELWTTKIDKDDRLIIVSSLLPFDILKTSEGNYEIHKKVFTKDMRKDYTILIIAHRLSTIVNADRIIVIDDGKVVGEGTHKQLLSKNKIYKKLYESEIDNS